MLQLNLISIAVLLLVVAPLIVLAWWLQERLTQRTEAERFRQQREERRRPLLAGFANGTSPYHLWVEAMPVLERVLKLRPPSRVEGGWHVADTHDGRPLVMLDDETMQLGEELLSEHAVTQHLASALFLQTSTPLLHQLSHTPPANQAALIDLAADARRVDDQLPNVEVAADRWSLMSNDQVQELCRMDRGYGWPTAPFTLREVFHNFWGDTELDDSDLEADCKANQLGDPSQWIAQAGGDDLTASFLNDHEDHEPLPSLFYDGNVVAKITLAWNDAPMHVTRFDTPVAFATEVLIQCLEVFQHRVRLGPPVMKP